MIKFSTIDNPQLTIISRTIPQLPLKRLCQPIILYVMLPCVAPAARHEIMKAMQQCGAFIYAFMLR